MAPKSFIPGNFWSELKRRRVVHVITVYAAIAFVILQLVDVVSEPLQLPGWTEALVIVLLCIGFVIAVFLSWVYDITPTGVRRTKPAHAVMHNGLTSHTSPAGWKIATLVSVLVIVALAAFNFISNGKEKANLSKLEKTIAVLPFENDSPDTTNLYFCNGMMDEILNNLQKIGDLEVKSRTSVERFRNTERDIKEIGLELGASLIVEGSVRKVDDNLRITVQLINAKTGNHLWAETYDGKYSKEIFSFQSNVARKVAGSLKAVISPGEERRLTAKPPDDIKAYDLVLKSNEMVRQWRYKADPLYLKLALNLLDQSIEIDPGYLDALATKSNIFAESRQFDSALFYSERVLQIDPESDLGYSGTGLIYFYSNQPDSALKYFFKADEIKPKDPWINLAIGQLYFFWKNEVVKGLPYYQKALDFGGGSEPEINGNISYVFFYIGDYGKAEKYMKKAVYIRPECEIIGQYEHILFTQGKYIDAFHFLDSICSITDCEKFCDITRFYIYTNETEYEKAEKYYIKTIASGYKQGALDSIFYVNHLYISYLYKETGRSKEAFSILKNSIKQEEDFLKKENNLITLSSFKIRLAASYSILGEKDKALRYLSELEKSGTFVEWPVSVRTFPGFDKLRNDPEFKAIIKSSEEKKASLRAEVKRLEQNGVINM